MGKEQLTFEKAVTYLTPSGSIIEYRHSDDLYDYFVNINISIKCHASDGMDNEGKPLFRFSKQYSQQFKKQTTI